MTEGAGWLERAIRNDAQPGTWCGDCGAAQAGATPDVKHSPKPRLVEEVREAFETHERTPGRLGPATYEGPIRQTRIARMAREFAQADRFYEVTRDPSPETEKRRDDTREALLDLVGRQVHGNDDTLRVMVHGAWRLQERDRTHIARLLVAAVEFATLERPDEGGT